MGFPVRRNGNTELLVYLLDINDESPVFMPGQTTVMSTIHS